MDVVLTIALWSIVGVAIFLLERRFRSNGQRLKKILSELERLKQEEAENDCD
mgnify:CR=1 FL=1